MSQFPWKTTCTFDGIMAMFDGEWRDVITDIQSNLPQWISEGKTDGWLDLEVVQGKTISIRYWVDQASAQAWADLLATKTIGGRTWQVVIEEIPG